MNHTYLFFNIFNNPKNQQTQELSALTRANRPTNHAINRPIKPTKITTNNKSSPIIIKSHVNLTQELGALTRAKPRDPEAWRAYVEFQREVRAG